MVPHVAPRSEIDAVVGYTEPPEPKDGEPRQEPQPIRLWERIVEAVRVGNYLEPAIKRAGVPKSTVYGWLEVAGRLRIKARGADIDPKTLSPFESVCLAMSDALDAADGMWEVGALATHERIMRGGIPLSTVTEEWDQTVSPPVIVKRKVVTSHTLPDARAIEWRLQHRMRERWGDRIEVRGEIAVTIDDEERAEDLVRTLDAYLEGLADQEAVEAATVARQTRDGNGSPSRASRATKPKPNGDGHANGDE